MKKKFLFLSIISIVGIKSYAGDFAPKTYSVKYLQNFGRVKGFVQIPKGGQFGSTTPRKPEFSQLGIKDVNFPELELSAKWDRLTIYGGVVYENFEGSAHLNESLKTHDRLIPKSSSIKTTHKYLAYNLGVEYELYRSEGFVISPLLEFSLMDFSYQFDAVTPENKKISSGRSFGWGMLSVGGNIGYIFTDKNRLDLTVKTAVLGGGVRDASSISLVNKYTFYEKDNKRLNLLLGVEASYLKFRDSQKDMQNYMTKKMSPTYKLGIEMEF